MTRADVAGVPVAALIALALGSAVLRAAPGSASGSLFVESAPAGASVYLDGRLAGETPLTVTTIAAGEHRVRVVRLGFLENSRLVRIKTGERATVRARLTDPAPQAPQTAALKIVVLEGEGAVNIIQQKTAVAPVIEVRDRNDQPVSGAVVKFAIQKGKASFDGARTLTVTTNAAGRATATGLTASGKGALQIAASAAFQGQTAAATIAQTTVMTAAEASSVATGSAATTGGGLSHAAIAGIAGGAGAGVAGAVIASPRSQNSGTPGSGPVTSRTFSGPVNGQLVVTRIIAAANGSVSCVSTRSITGTMTIQLDQRADGTITGSLSTNGRQDETSITQSIICIPNLDLPFNPGGPVSGAGGSVGFSQQNTSSGPQIGTVTDNLAFNGTLGNGVITGTMSYSQVWSGTTASGAVSGGGSTTLAVTLR